MKPILRNPFHLVSAIIPVLLVCTGQVGAADRIWDGGTANIAADGNGLPTYGAGNWSTAIANWDQGTALPHVTWNNAGPDNAIFGGSPSTAGTVDLQMDITVNQIKFTSGNNTNNYRIGATSPIETSKILFGGSYGDAFPTLDGPGSINYGIYAKISGTINGGLVISSDSDVAVGEGGRVYLANTTNDFVGDVTVLKGNLHALSNLGAATNKLILKGGAIYGNTGSTVAYSIANRIEVAADSTIGFNATGGTSTMTLSGSFSGAGNITSRSSGGGAKAVILTGDMSGYTGTFDNLTGFVTIQTSAPSGGKWKVSGGTLKLNAAGNDAIAHGTGTADLVVNGGILNLNGKAESINGLSGTGGTIENQLAATTATLTLGDGNATATFGGVVRNNAGTGGTTAITKTGTGSQTLTGPNSYTGATTVNAGTLVLASKSGLTPVTVAPSATFGVKLIADISEFVVPSLTTGTGAGSVIQLDTGSNGTVLDPIITATTFTPGSGATTLLKLKGFDFTTGTMPLVKYTTLDGAGFAGLAKQLPYRVVGTLVDNTTDPGDKHIDLEITSAESAVWNGDLSGDWDVDPDAAGTGGTQNWRTSVTNAATRYAQGATNTDQVTFNDAAAGTTTVNLTTTLTPLNVLVNNSIAKTYTFTGTGKLSGETALEKQGDGTLIIANTGVNDHTGGTFVTAGTLQLGDGSTTGAGRLAGTIATAADLAFFYPEAVTVGNGITGMGTVLKLGTNTLTLNAANTYSGGSIVRSGILAAATNTALGSGEVRLGDATSGSAPVGVTLDNREDVANSIWVSPDGTGTATLAASNTGTGTANPASFTGLVTLDRATTLRNDLAGDRLVFSGKITSTLPAEPEPIMPPITLTVTGGQNVTLQSTANNFAGTIQVTGAGTVLQASHNTTQEVLPDAVTVDLAAGTFLKLYASGGNLSETIAGLTGTGTVVRHEAATTGQILAVGAGDVSSTFDGVIRNNPGTGTGTLGLTKKGTGTFTLTGANLHTGFTTVEAGTLMVTGSISGPSNVTGGTLAGTGTVGAVTVTASGKVSPGTAATIGTLAAGGNVSFATGTELVAQINTDGTPASDRLAVTGNLTLGNATLVVSDLGTAVLTGTTRLVLATYSGTRTGTFNGLAEGSAVTVGGNTFTIQYDDPEGPLKAVTLEISGTGGYAAWATTNGVGAADADHDNDGVENAVEYVLGTDPKVPSSAGITGGVTATEFKFTFNRSDASETPDAAVSIETSNDLVHWDADGSPYAVGATGVGSVAIVENPASPAADPGYDAVTLTVPRNTAAKFARLKVVITP